PPVEHLAAHLAIRPVLVRVEERGAMAVQQPAARGTAVEQRQRTGMAAPADIDLDACGARAAAYGEGRPRRHGPGDPTPLVEAHAQALVRHVRARTLRGPAHVPRAGTMAGLAGHVHLRPARAVP